MLRRAKDRLLSTTMLKVTASLCFVILLGLHYKLISDAYEVKNAELFRVEKERIKQAYEKAIINDKLFPGGQNIIDSILSVEVLKELEILHTVNRPAFYATSSSLYRDIVVALKQDNTIDSLLARIFYDLGLESDTIEHSLLIHTFLLTFDGKEYVTFGYKPDQTFENTLLSGNSHIVRPPSLVSTITVSNALPYTYRFGFALYIQQERAIWHTLVGILPLLCLSGVSILLMLFVYFVTFNNWIKQKKLNEIISDFVNSITHEYKTPISTIKVCVKNLRREVRDQEGMDNINTGLSIIERQSDRLNNLIDQVIYVSMFDPGKIKKTEQPIVQDLETVLNDLRLKYQQNKNVYIQSHLPIQDLYVKYNLFLFTTVLINLVQNAVKYNDSDIINVHVDLKEIHGKLSLSVTDNGIGIAGEDLNYVFDRFYQGKSVKNRGGIGLGLYYVRQLVVTHNWKIDVKSKVNQGTTVTITMSEYK